MFELDLHSYTVDEALRLFVNFYNRHAGSGNSVSLRIVHGYGSTGEGGKIQRKLREFLTASSSFLEWKMGEAVDGNPGVTFVYPHKKLPAIQSRLESKILAFCSIPRTESKISGEFRTYSPREIKDAIRALVRRSALKVVLKGDRETFVDSNQQRLSHE